MGKVNGIKLEEKVKSNKMKKMSKICNEKEMIFYMRKKRC